MVADADNDDIIDAMEDPDDIESAYAGLLTGTMITLLGAAIPAFLLWQVITHWSGLVSGAHEMTSSQAMQGFLSLGLSARLLWFGVRMNARQVAWLRRRHRSRSAL
ncbi:hypothetical protein [Brevundimonas sp.]|uniref:hypothetical protein n=1 Tax=Brevundimonas sp. TaxID=1871086 RepID=UPI003BAD606F